MAQLYWERMRPDANDPAIADLAIRPQWVCWRQEPCNGKAKPKKVPYDPKTGRRASVRDLTTWTSYDVALAVAGQYDGLGYVLTAEDPYVGVDLDDCRDPETGAIEAWAHAIVERLDSYTEVTPSERGVRVWVRAKLPPGGRRTGRV